MYIILFYYKVAGGGYLVLNVFMVPLTCLIPIISGTVIRNELLGLFSLNSENIIKNLSKAPEFCSGTR